MHLLATLPSAGAAALSLLGAPPAQLLLAGLGLLGVLARRRAGAARA